MGHRVWGSRGHGLKDSGTPEPQRRTSGGPVLPQFKALPYGSPKKNLVEKVLGNH